MITEFEQKLAQYLNTSLPSPFTGRVSVADGTKKNPGPHPAVTVGVTQCRTASADIGSTRPEIVPGSSDFRRVLRLQCMVNIAVYPSNSGKRPEEISGVESIFYLLDSPDVKNGKALLEIGDPGFVIQSLHVTELNVPFFVSPSSSTAAGLTLTADGWFWPVGVAGQTGIKIGTIRIREIIYTVLVEPMTLYLITNGSPQSLTITLSTTGPVIQTADSVSTETEFGGIYCYLIRPDGQPPSGTLSEGVDTGNGIHQYTITSGHIMLTYTPGALSGTEVLVITLDNGRGEPGIEIGRYNLNVMQG